MGFAAWSTETGRAWQTKSQLQAAADSAALAGAGNLLSADFLTVDEAGARSAATTYGAQHKAARIARISRSPPRMSRSAAGTWRAQTFTALPGNTDPDVVRAVRVITRRDDNANGPIDTILGRALGVDSITVNTDAIAEWSFAGGGKSRCRGSADYDRLLFDFG